MLSIKQINQEIVKPVRFKEEEEDKRPVRGRDLFPEIYGNIFFCARKKSGKTCSIYHIIDRCSTKETSVIAFVSTLNRDPTWKAIQNLCKKRGIDFTGFTSLRDEETKEDILGSIVKTLEKQADEEKSEGSQATQPRRALYMEGDDNDDDTKTKRPKEKAPKIIFVLDDLSGELKNPSVTELLKKNRHFKCKVLLSSQYWNDISLSGRKQIDYALLFRGLLQSMDKLEEIYKNIDLAVPFETFVAIYRICTAEKFNFMWIDVVNSEFRKNFSHRIQVRERSDRQA